MKTIFTKIFKLLDRIGKDKYQHFALGSVLALLVFIVAQPIFEFAGRGASYWIAYALSFIITMGVEAYKEWYLDVKADWRDVLATFLGGSVVWAALAFAY